MKQLLITLFILCCLLTPSLAQNVDITAYSQNAALHDTVVIPIHDADNIAASRGMIVETYQIPGYDLYNQYWDVENLRSRKLTIPFANDRLMLLLVQASNNPFQMPCVFDEISLPYGITKQGNLHPGIDLMVQAQTLVKCCFDGVVRMAKFYGQYGKVVVVRHYNGLETVYAHLDKICVRPGQLLNAGDVIGQTGQTGNSPESVLHFEIRFMNEFFNPELVIDFENETLIKNTLVLQSGDFTSTDLTDVQPVHSESSKPHTLTQQKPQAQTIPQNQLKPTTQPQQPASQVLPNLQEAHPQSSEQNQPQVSAETQYHTVKAGETLYRISITYNISIDKLKELNHLQNGDVIQAGQKLRVQ